MQDIFVSNQPTWLHHFRGAKLGCDLERLLVSNPCHVEYIYDGSDAYENIFLFPEEIKAVLIS